MQDISQAGDASNFTIGSLHLAQLSFLTLLVKRVLCKYQFFMTNRDTMK